MIQRPSCAASGGDTIRHFSPRVVLAMALVLSACVSDADPRDENPGPSDARSGSDVRDADQRDSARTDAVDGSVREDGGDPRDGDAGDDRTVDAADELTARDAGDAADVRDPDVTDVTTDPGVTDAAIDAGGSDAGGSDADARIDATDAGSAIDVVDSGSPIDVSDAGAGSDARDAGNDGDASAPDTLGDSGGSSDAPADAGIVVFYQENFDSGFGTFSQPVNVCGNTQPQWSNIGGYLHAADPATTGVTRIASPAVTVPANTSNITLRMSHRFDTEEAFDAGQLLISVNGATAVLVTTFTSGGYTSGGQTNPANCNLTNMPGQFPGWSGTQAEWVSEVNLSAAPFNVGPGNTLTITFRMTTDSIIDGVGWDINWVTLSGSSP
jgi:hypothetical protein